MEVIVTKEQLRETCGVHTSSPEWNAEREALVYPDWDATVARLLSTRKGTAYLDALVARGIVPMTRDEFIEARKSRRGF
jgi:hypothetical protein